MARALAAAEGVLELHMLQHLRAGRNKIELLARYFADALERAATRAHLRGLGKIMLDSDARQRCVDGLPLAALARVGRNLYLARLGLLIRFRGERFRLVEQIELGE